VCSSDLEVLPLPISDHLPVAMEIRLPETLNGNALPATLEPSS
jgi:hypothetical protein